MSDSLIGKNCIVHSGVVIGSDGFGFVISEDKSYSKIPQIGNVLSKTMLKLVLIQQLTGLLLALQLLILELKLIIWYKSLQCFNWRKYCHSCSNWNCWIYEIGKNCLIGGQVGIAGHLIIGNNVKIQGQTGITKNVNDGIKPRLIYEF